jgi:hypothetical protein
LIQEVKIPKNRFSADSQLNSGIVIEKSIMSESTFLMAVSHGKLWKKGSI